MACSSPQSRIAGLYVLAALGRFGVSTAQTTLPDLPLDADDECAATASEDGRHCGLNALQLKSLKVRAPASKCGPLSAPENNECREPVTWSAGDGKNNPKAPEWYAQMRMITGVAYTNASATLDDWQRLYYCSPPGGKFCGTPPCNCTNPPCNTCLGGLPPRAGRPACAAGDETIECKPPDTAFGYKGMEWPTITVDKVSSVHFFAIGDWGGLDGTLKPIEDRPNLIVYNWGNQPGPSVFPRSRVNAHHSKVLCDHKQFVECFNTHGAPPCHPGCGYVDDIDSKPQLLVAEAFKKRAAQMDPALILNVGDNFYWGGIEKNCGTPMHQMAYTTWHQFDQIFEGVYQGKGLDNKPWLSVLGNHDWGGRQFNNGWDQQVAYTWHSNRWIMPAPYYMVHVDFKWQYFSADIFMIDSNFNDAHDPSKDSEHNLCGSHNPPDANCSSADGPPSIEECPGYFHKMWQEQKDWLEGKLANSTASWQIVVTHFPCGEDGEHQRWYKKLHQKFGLDLLVTGHRHDQELWLPSMTWKNWMGGLTCLVTGGGGGITSEATPNPMDKKDWYGEAQYGFYDLTITRFSIRIQSINFNGAVLKETYVYPTRGYAR